MPETLRTLRTATVPVVADRVIKARRESVCAGCHGPVRVTNRIARCPAGAWFHLSCYLAEGGHRHFADRPGECASAEAGQ
jgi:hypothetical protein